AVREAVGLVDLSHMGALRIGDETLVQRVVSRDVTRLRPGRIQYALLCNDAGGIIDDVLVYVMPDSSYLLVVNAGNQDGDFEWIKAQAQGDGAVSNVGRDWALVGVQGPRAVGLVQRLTRSELGDVKYYAFVEGAVANVPCVISRTGYTGEDGFELLDRSIRRNGYRVVSEGKEVGTVTSGNVSFTLGYNIGMAYVPPAMAQPGTRLGVDIRGTAAPAEVVPLPFYKRPHPK